MESQKREQVEITWSDLDEMLVRIAEMNSGMSFDAVAGYGAGGDYMARILASIIGIDVAEKDEVYSLLMVVSGTDDDPHGMAYEILSYNAHGVVPLFIAGGSFDKDRQNYMIDINKAEVDFPWTTTPQFTMSPN